MRKKKELLERKAALVKENGEHLARLDKPDFSGDVKVELSAIEARETEIQNLEADIKAIEQLEQRTRQNAARVPHIEVHDLAEDKPFLNIGEHLQAVRMSSMGIVDPRLHKLAAGQNEAEPTSGGFLVPPEFADGLIEKTYAAAAIAPLCDSMPLQGNSIKMNAVDETSRANGSRYGGIQTYWGDEASTITASQAKFRQMELRLKKMTGLTYLTNEMMSDAPACSSYLNRAFPMEFGFKLDDSFVRGTGAGQPLGILNALCTVSQAAEGGQTAATIVMNNISKMFSRLWTGSRKSARWFYNTDIEPTLLTLNLSVGNNAFPVYLPPGTGITGNPFGTLMGLPMIPIEQAETVGTVGDIMLCDFGEYQLARKGTIEVAVSQHVKFLTDETAFRFILRIDGQPKWNSALTPYKGTATKSPFVTLAARP